MQGQVVRFGGVEVDMRLREVRRGKTAAVRLQEQPFQLLALMLDRPGDVVTREAIRQRLWPDGTSVDFEHSELHTCRTRLSMDKAKSVLGYAPPITVHEGLRRSAEFLRMSQDGAGAGDGRVHAHAGAAPEGRD